MDHHGDPADRVHQRTRRRRRLRGAAAVLVATAVLAGCGVSGGEDGGREPEEEPTSEIPAASGRSTEDDPARGPRARVTEGDPYDHWHAAFGIDLCGVEQDPLPEVPGDPDGIHTHGDGLIHIHPFSRRASLERATLARFFDQVQLEVTNEGFTTPDGSTYRAGQTECDGAATEVVLAHWADAATAASAPPDQVFTSDFGDVRFLADGGAYTLALVPVGTDLDDLAPPATAAKIASLGAIDGG